MTLSRQTSVLLAEVAFLLIMLAGIWLVAAGALENQTFRTIVAGSLLAIAGLLLTIATHRGHFGAATT